MALWTARAGGSVFRPGGTYNPPRPARKKIFSLPVCSCLEKRGARVYNPLRLRKTSQGRLLNSYVSSLSHAPDSLNKTRTHPLRVNRNPEPAV